MKTRLLKSAILAAIALPSLCILNSCSQSEKATVTETSTETLEPSKLGEIPTLHKFGDVYLASQPQEADFEIAKNAGVKTVINMRHPEEMTDFNEEATVTALGLEYVNLPWAKPEELTDEVFDRARELLNTSEKPILLHCSSANRVGAVWIPWRVLDGGIDIEDAIEEAKTIGIRTPEYEPKARDYVQRKQHKPN
ncbi:MAG: protein tyrosine phosphatase family protein [Akkermansiaceae bacterium]|jgi:uncharacterized protein (TIGR01244 family)|nr:protein tyrosine phosphatase family protein [Akkermansiaceae bacterium]MDP4778889.1 protein tyrosine phosphatase family protein [Akkermansiaceae bacterium]